MVTFIEIAHDFRDYIGRLYTIFLKRVLPFILYLIPINIIITRSSDWIVSHFLRGIQDLLSDFRSPYFLVMWVVVALIFLTLLIAAPKAATVFEFVFGILFIIFALKFNYLNMLGITLIIAISVFLFFKLLYLFVDIMYRKTGIV